MKGPECSGVGFQSRVCRVHGVCRICGPLVDGSVDPYRPEDDLCLSQWHPVPFSESLTGVKVNVRYGGDQR